MISSDPYSGSEKVRKRACAFFGPALGALGAVGGLEGCLFAGTRCFISPIRCNSVAFLLLDVLVVTVVPACALGLVAFWVLSFSKAHGFAMDVENLYSCSLC